MDNEDLKERMPPRRSRLRTFLKCVVLSLCLLLVAAGVIYGLALQTPDFYQASLGMSELKAFEGGESFEIAGLYLRNDIVEEETWYAEFFEDHINGWLISDMPRKFPRSLPDNMRQPRVKIDPGKFRVGVTTEILGIETVLTAAAEFFPTDASNEFGLRVLGVHAGSLPLPVSFFSLPASELLQKQGIRVQWYDDKDGLPVAVMTVPKKLLRHNGQHIQLEQFEFIDGSVRLAGRSEPVKKESVSKLNQVDGKSVDADSESRKSNESVTKEPAPDTQEVNSGSVD